MRNLRSSAPLFWIAAVVGLLVTGSVRGQADRPTEFELNRQLMSFYGNYQEGIAETLDRLIVADPSPERRYFLQTVKVVYSNAALEIASDAAPAHQLMDMLILLRLQSLVWAGGGSDEIGPADARIMADTLRRLESELSALASRVFSADTIDAVRALAEQWKVDHPGREYVAFVRLQNLPESEAKTLVREQARSHGLFAQIEEANREIEQTRYAAERALFIANHMPLLVQWQAELLLYRAFSMPEVTAMLGEVGDFVAVSDRLTTVIDELPAELAEALGTNQESLELISDNIRISSENFRVITERLAPLFERTDENSDGDFDLTQLERIVSDAARASDRLAQTSANIGEFVYSEPSAEHAADLMTQLMANATELIDSRIEVADERVQAQRERIFLLLIALILIFFGCRVAFLHYQRFVERRDR